MKVWDGEPWPHTFNGKALDKDNDDNDEDGMNPKRCVHLLVTFGWRILKKSDFPMATSALCLASLK